MASEAAVPAASDAKATNPKDMLASDRVPLGLVPAIPLGWQALAHLEGNLKYGLVNWREAGVRASVYIDALIRHLEKFKEGEWADPQTHVPHLASVCACANILMDARACGKLTDDRPLPSPTATAYQDMEQVVHHLRMLHADKRPTHFTIAGPTTGPEAPSS